MRWEVYIGSVRVASVNGPDSCLAVMNLLKTNAARKIYTTGLIGIVLLSACHSPNPPTVPPVASQPHKPPFPDCTKR